jgi:copper(I)-binding protein
VAERTASVIPRAAGRDGLKVFSSRRFAARPIAHSTDRQMKYVATLAFAGALLAAGAARAHDYTLGSLHIEHPWTRATPKGAAVGGGYLKITNSGTQPDRLIGGSSTVAGRFEVHEMSMDNGVMRMRPLKNGLEIKPGQTVALAPGGLHIMLLDLKTPIKEGDHVKGTLVFEKAGSVDVDYIAVGIGGTPKGGAASSHGSHDMQGMPGMQGH